MNRLAFSRRFSLSQPAGRLLFILLGSMFVLISLILLVFFAYGSLQLQSYVEGRCTIAAKHLQREEHTQTSTSNGTTQTRTTVTYTPDFQFTVRTTDGHTYTTHGYDALNSGGDQASQQAILDLYTVGKTYPCWYDPAQPTHAVLTRQFPWVLLLIPGIFGLIGVVFVLVGLLGAGRRTFRWRFKV